MKKNISILSLYKFGLKYLKRYSLWILLSVLLMFVTVGLNLLEVEYIKRLIDTALSGKQDLYKILFVFLILIVVKIITTITSSYANYYIDTHVHTDLKNDFTESLMLTGVEEISAYTSGELISKHNNDLSIIHRFISSSYTSYIFNPLMSVAAFIYLCSIQWKLTLFIFITTPILTVLLNKMSKRAGQIRVEILDHTDNLNKKFKDTIDGIETIKVYNLQSYFAQKITGVLERLFQSSKKYSKNDAITVSLILGVSYLPRISILIIGGYMVVQRAITIAELIAFNQLISKVITPTINTFSTLNQLREAQRVLERIDPIFNLPKEPSTGEKYALHDSNCLAFDNVSFQYENGKKVLNKLNFHLAKGECLGIIGPSGIGKSTIINLINRFYAPDQGQIKLYGKNIEDWDLTSLREQFACMSQETFLFPETVMENIRYGHWESTDTEVINAAKAANAHEFIEKLPDTYQTILGEKGTGLSGGEKQRIALARVLLKNSPVLLFDEPTSSLDPKSESLFLNSLRKSIEGKSVIIISHRFSTVQLCNRILVLHNGQIAEEGSHDSLMSKKGLYYQLFKEQIEVE